jgi:hypothetical protein
MISLFNSQAQLDLSAVTPAEISALTDAEQALLAALIAAHKVADGARDRVLTAQPAMVDCVREHDESLAAQMVVNPAPSQIEALRAVQEAYRNSH